MTRTKRSTMKGHIEAITLWIIVAGTALVGCGEEKTARPSGTLEATEVDVAPLLQGRVLTVGAEKGETVQAGDTLLAIDTELLQLKRRQTAANGASIEAQLVTARDAVAQAERRLQLLETNLERVRKLNDEGSATQQELDNLEAERDIAEHGIEQARHQLDVIRAERVKLRAALDVLDRQLEDGVVLCPVDGTVLVRNIEPGEVAAPGRTALRLADLSTVELRLYLEAGVLDKVKLGDTFAVYVDALDGESLQGRVNWIASEAEFTPKNVQTREARAQLVYAVTLEVENPDGRLAIGMPAEAELGW
ncbi:HlyD family efflux transporter periplasmic adaptor subunit [bacterium]|nr:HlyD family efflux transporter periplasmic adaptor subunit [bacterium]